MLISDFMALNNLNNEIKERQVNNGLESLLADFSRLTGKRPEKLYGNVSEAEGYYAYISKNLNANYSLSDVEKFSGITELDAMLEDEENSSKLGLFISAALNKAIRKGEKVSISARKPINYLCYKLKDAEAYLDIAGDLVGCYSDNSKIHINRLVATDKNIISASNSEIIPAGMGILFLNALVLYHLNLGYSRKNSEIYINEINYLHKGNPLYKHAEYILTVDYNLKMRSGNKVFLGEDLYNQHPLMFMLRGIKKWEKEADLG
ncbi:hypothetical protein M1558_04190 [Candidatus Parvarchaeota archaeon]|nr:hypothetical protein [Candidatus Parvarchaeota archaeon]